jgi:GWxTD domain-containing protein
VIRPLSAAALIVVLGAGGLGAGGCASRLGGDLPGSAQAWIEGPVRWLVLPEEVRRFRRLSSQAEVLAFIDEFWQRRDPDPAVSGNPFAQRFFERVQAANLLYAGEGGPGSLTDRGRVLILLGSPSVLRYTQKSAPTWQPGGVRSGRPSATERLRIEVWGYEPADLPGPLLARLKERAVEFPVEVLFVEEGRATILVSGEDLLEDAARAAVREDG